MRRFFIQEQQQKLDLDGPGDPNSLNYAIGVFITASMIILFGLTMLYSTSSGMAGSTYFVKQLMWAGVGLVCGMGIFIVGYKKLSEYSMIFIAISAVLLLIADFCFPPINGAYRWIKLPGIGNIQPSEFAKLAVCVFLAKYCAEKMRYLNKLSVFKGIVPAVLVTGVVMLLILKGKDLGTTSLIAMVSFLIFFAAGVRLAFILLPLLIVIPSGIIFIKHFDPMRWSRMTTFMNPELYQKDDGYQLWNSMLALGSGYWQGMGFMESRMKAQYLPEAHTDFILAIVGEELGFICLALIIVAYLVFTFFGIKISLGSNNKQGMLLGFGITSIIALQAMINIGVVSGGFPTKGMPAPFISYGGSNLVMCLMGVGLLVSIALETSYPGLNKEIIAEAKSKLMKLLSYLK
ncbi:MAG: hypothetical protein A2017_12265 [Lentisphaerae bacterium GWF2_44_16]|nr:MAG: hypothetical protein A2017_12265 [Lentisphaerae bacterium GWF2_44_16]